MRLRLSWAALRKQVSIHAPVWGATLMTAWMAYLGMFQSTHPCGVRLKAVVNGDMQGVFQSTHPCGVRPPIWYNRVPRSRFNPRTRVGCDIVPMQLVVWWVRFQSTHPCGVRLVFSQYIDFPSVSIHAPVWGATKRLRAFFHISACFNPRTRVGCDVRLIDLGIGLEVSIHAPVWGATDNFNSVIF